MSLEKSDESEKIWTDPKKSVEDLEFKKTESTVSPWIIRYMNSC